MTDQPAVDQAGVARTPDGTGTIADLSPTALASDTSSPNTSLTTPEPTTDGKTLLTEAKKDEPAKEPAKGAPEKYEDYKVPEGFTLDPAVKTEADTLFKGMGLNQEQAQSLVDFYTKKTAESAEAPYEAYRKMTDEWRTTAESHPDLKGKLGPGQEVNVRISKALDSLADPQLASDFKSLMDLTGAGNNVAFIRVIDKWAQRLTEGTHVAGNGPAKAGTLAPGESSKPSAAGAIWPNLPSASR